MEKELLPIKKIVLSGLLGGLFFASSMALYDYFFTDESFSFVKFTFHFLIFGFVMAITFRFKYTKKKED